MRRVTAAAVIALVACTGADTDDAEMNDAAATDSGTAPAAQVSASSGDSITVSFTDTTGADAGTARLVGQPGGVEISVRVTGLTPGEHGFHVHETGQCDAPSFESAGSHYSPEPREHGLENPAGPHAGDLPNLVADAQGVADTVFTVDRLTFQSDSAAPLIKAGGLALMVHADPDDQRTDPSGNSGNRVACAVLAPPQ